MSRPIPKRDPDELIQLMRLVNTGKVRAAIHRLAHSNAAFDKFFFRRLVELFTECKRTKPEEGGKL